MFGTIKSDHRNLISQVQIPYHRKYSQPQQVRYNSPHYNGQSNFENINFNCWCETCDKGFRTSAQLEIHKQHHQKCNIDGCQFVAHPKIITKHIQMQHSTGLYSKIAKLNNPEEIKKWREERKKKYPTKENIEKKTAAIKEKIARGEKIGVGINRHPRHKDKFNNSDGRQRNNFFSKYDNNRRKRPLHNDHNSNNIPNSKKVFKPIKIVEEEPRKLKPFSGIQGLIFNDDSDDMKEAIEENVKDLIEDDEFAEDITFTKENTTDTSKPMICGALTSLMCDYGSSDEDVAENISKDNECKAGNKYKVVIDSMDNKETTKYSVNKTAKVSIENKPLLSKDTANGDKNNIGNKDSDSDSGPEEKKVIKVENTENTKQEYRKEKVQKVKKYKCFSREKKPLKRKLPSTLLEKLLNREIEQERNIILQCIRYIVKNNYFEQNK